MSDYHRKVIPLHIRDAVKAAPMLSEAEERAAVECGDYDLLVRSHLRLVVKIACNHLGYGEPFVDLYSEGCAGLVHAAPRFKLGTGARFATYAVFWIRASITEYIIRNHRMVKLGTTAAQKKLFFHRSELNQGTSEEIAERLSVPIADVETMRERLQPDSSLNAPATGEDGDISWIEMLADDAPSQAEVYEEEEEAQHRRELLQRALATLPERERAIVLARFSDVRGTYARGTGETLEILSLKFGISRERIRQLEARGLEMLREELGLIPRKNRGGRFKRAA